MSCYSCSSEFGILKKQVGCEICGFAFCSRCCKKQEVPSQKGVCSKKVTCNKCLKQLTGEACPSKGSPPLAHKKRMETLMKSMSVDSSEWSNEKDKALVERLQRLKRDRIKDALPSEGEIEERLAKLKGMDPMKYKAPPIQVFLPPPKRTSIEQASDLLKQITEEVDLDSRRVKPEDEIAARLAALKDEEPVKVTKPSTELNIPSFPEQDSTEAMDVEKTYSAISEESCAMSEAVSEEVKELNINVEYKKLLASMQHGKGETEVSDDDDEAEADKLVEKLLASNLDDEDMDKLESLNGTEAEKSSTESVVEEFPWCVICTEDAKMRCFDCEGDLYCIRCFKECHDSLDIRDHKTCPYLTPEKPPK